MKALGLTMWAGGSNKEISQTDCPLKTTGHVDSIIHVNVLGTCVYICTRYDAR